MDDPQMAFLICEKPFSWTAPMIVTSDWSNDKFATKKLQWKNNSQIISPTQTIALSHHLGEKELRNLVTVVKLGWFARESTSRRRQTVRHFLSPKTLLREVCQCSNKKGETGLPLASLRLPGSSCWLDQRKRKELSSLFF